MIRAEQGIAGGPAAGPSLMAWAPTCVANATGATDIPIAQADPCVHNSLMALDRVDVGYHSTNPYGFLLKQGSGLLFDCGRPGTDGISFPLDRALG